MSVLKFIRKSFLKNKNFTILANNCIAGFIYKRYGLKFLSPTVNINIPPNDFIKFCKNYEYYISLELTPTTNFDQAWFTSIGGGEIGFPVGKLGDITLYFQHEKNFQEAKKNWDRRKLRINKDNIFIVLFDINPDKNTLNEFEKIKTPKKIYLYYKGNLPTTSYTFKIQKLENNSRNWYSRMNRLNPFSKKYYEQFNFTNWFNEHM